MIGEYTKIDERSSVKKSCVGAHCVIGKNVKIANSVIMDHVVIGDKWVYLLYFKEKKSLCNMWFNSLMFSFSVKIDGCIICNNANIQEKAYLKDCDVAGGYIVEKDSKAIQIRTKRFYWFFFCFYLGQLKGEKLVAFRESI